MEVQNEWRPPPGFRLSTRRDLDFESLDGRAVIEIKLGAQGVRDLHGAMMHLAVLLHEQPLIQRAYLVIKFPRVRFATAFEAWVRGRALLQSNIAERLQVVLVTPDNPDPWFEEGDVTAARIARSVATGLHNSIIDQPLARRSVGPTSHKFFEFWKVLLRGWLRGERPARLQQIADVAGCSHQTAIRSLSLLDSRGELSTKMRDTTMVALGAFPRATFEQAVGLSGVLRRTRWFIDVSGRTPDPSALYRRFEKRQPENVAVGGVTAARQLDPTFDLHGSPRLDITIWAPERMANDASFIAEVDPALRESPDKDGAVLALHRLSRARPLFEVGDGPLPRADPVEVLLDLYEIGLAPQADELVKVLRGRASDGPRRRSP